MNHPRPLSRHLVRSFDTSLELRRRPVTNGGPNALFRYRISRRLNGERRNVVDLHGFPGSLIREHHRLSKLNGPFNASAAAK